MMAQMRIRRVGALDWPQVRSLRLSMLAESAVAFGAEDAARRAMDGDRWRERHRSSVAWHAVAGDDPVGSAALTAQQDDPTVAELHSIWVAPEYRGRGIARRLVQTALRFWMREAGTRLELWVQTSNVPAKALYEREGFQPSNQTRWMQGHLEQHYARRM
jgi:ribosomal protein S18 acetylase RimI-like enzyme